VRLEWDEAKSRDNERKHGISLEEAGTLFASGADYLEIFDEEHSVVEDRFIAIGPLRRGLAFVVWADRDEDTIRIISARWATKQEQVLYESHLERKP